MTLGQSFIMVPSYLGQTGIATKVISSTIPLIIPITTPMMVVGK